MRRTVVFVLAALAASLVIAPAAPAASHTWAAFPIGPMEPGCGQNCDDDITAWDINGAGWVAGDAFPDFHWPWVWKEGQTPALISPGHVAFPGFDDAGFTGINSAGDTSGYANGFNEGIDQVHALLFMNGAFTDLGTLQGQAGSATAFALNDTDTVVGVSTTAAGPHHAFAWTPGRGMRDLGTLGGAESLADGVNAANVVVGWADTAAGRRHAFRFEGGHMADLGALGGRQSEALAINAGGAIAGWATTASGARHAFLRTASGMRDLGKLLHAFSSTARDVTNAGDVVGTARDRQGEFSWVYTGGRMIDLRRRTVTCCDLSFGALNHRLQIVPRGQLESTTVSVLEPVAAFDETSSRIAFTGGWVRSAAAGAWGGHVTTAQRAGASASLTFRGKRVWWIAPGGPGFGEARVFVDGTPAATVDLANAGAGPSRTAFLRSFANVGTHTIRVVVVGTAGRPAVALDAFAVSQT